MSKYLMLFRHAHSLGIDSATRDHERTLSPRGEQGSRDVAQQFAAQHPAPELIISSSAQRAQSSANLAKIAANWECNIEIQPSLYESRSADVLRLLHATADNLQYLMLVGHEPTWSDLANKLCGRNDLHFSTATIMCLGFDVSSWGLVDYGTGDLGWIIRPQLP